MKLLEEKLTNFKGMRSAVFKPDGADITLYGDNGTGKTTFLDGFLWVLVDKDSAGRRDFELKTLEADGTAAPMLEHSVEVRLEVDGAVLTLRKALTESWVKARGAASAQFSGHRTAYAVNGVPVQKKEYDAVVARLCDEKVLRLLIDPFCFAAKLPWQERRRILLAVCGEVADAEVVAAAPELAELTELQEGRSLEEFRRLLAARKTALNSELRTVPVRVDEANRALSCIESALEQLRQQARQRVADLKADEQALADEYTELERQTFLTEEFVRTQVRLLEERINSRFHLARFRLFERQVNGALNEVCEVLGPDGVPYNGGLNHAGCINTGIDIINTLSEHYGFSAPIFVDNAEAVTRLAATPAQLIRLCVSAADPCLRLEKAG